MFNYFRAYFLLFLFIPATVLAVPGRIRFQGRLTDANKTQRNGTFSMTFRICDSLAGSCVSPLWTETQPSVQVTNGLFATRLGMINALSETIFTGDTTYLEIEVEGETLTPRERLVSSPYSFQAALADDISDGSSKYIAVQNTLQLGTTFYVSSGAVSGPFSVGGTITAGSARHVITNAAGLLDATKLTGLVPNTSLSGSSVTLQGNQFNGANQLVRLNASSGLTLTGSLVFSGPTTDLTTAGNEHLVLRPAGTGRVGVGTASPASMLHVSSPSAAAAESVFTVSGAQDILTAKGDGTVDIATRVRNQNYLVQVYDSAGGLSLGTSFSPVPWNAQIAVDPIFSHSTSVNNSRVTVNRTGLYRISYVVLLDVPSGNTRTTTEMECAVNGSAAPMGRTYGYNRQSSDGVSSSASTFMLNLTSGDYVEVRAQRRTTGTVDTISGSSLLIEFIR